MEYIKQAAQLLFSADKELIQIIVTTLLMSFFSTFFSCLAGVPLGIIIGRHKFKGKRFLLKILNTLMSIPPVVAGLLVFILFRSVGPFGGLHLIFTLPSMVIAQVILITPAVTSISASSIGEGSINMTETAKGLGMPLTKQIRLLLTEFSSSSVSIILMAFGRSVAEVGAVSLVGGNIQFKTRVMTTAILLEANKGDMSKAIALGIILMLISFAVNFIAGSIGGYKNART